MILQEGQLENLTPLCQGTEAMAEGGITYVYLPGLRINQNDGTVIVRDALLCPMGRDGYTTRLFLSESIPGKGQNWTQHRILNRTWHTCSVQGIPPGRLVEVLAEHLVMFR